jgi:hypothetical protein
MKEGRSTEASNSLFWDLPVYYEHDDVLNSSYPRIENYLFVSLVTGMLDAVAFKGVHTERIIYRSSECATECLRHWAGSQTEMEVLDTRRRGKRRIGRGNSILGYVSMYMKARLIRSSCLGIKTRQTAGSRCERTVFVESLSDLCSFSQSPTTGNMSPSTSCSQAAEG